MSVLTLSHVHYKNDFNTCRTVHRGRRPLLYRPMTVVHLKEYQILGKIIGASNLQSVYDDKKLCLKTRTNFLQHSNSAYPLLTKKDFSGKTTLPKLTLSTCCAIPLRRGSGTLPLFSITVFQKYKIQISSKSV